MSRKEYKKVYQGIPKAITDEHTLFYAENFSCDKLSEMPTGYGSLLSGIDPITKSNINTSCICVDFWIKSLKNHSTSGSWFNIIEGYNNDTREFTITHDQYSLFITYPNFNWNNSFVVSLNSNMHVRIVIYDNNVLLYINGKVKWRYSYTNYNLSNINKIMIMNGGHPIANSEIYISDLHISNIDRGGYFPNLPQEFIDGKAVIKPRLGQQQIKGDPMYSQATLLKVLNANNIHSSDYYNIDGYMYYVNSPELKTTGSYSWASSSTITIKSLNNEVISGVIDSNTALCKAIKYIVEGTNAQLEVDDVSRLSIGDTLKVFNSLDFRLGSEILTVTNIDTSSNIITLSGTISTYNNHNIRVGWDSFIETTSSSSVPIVKTEDDVRVEGTWSGLGTREATFTLGTNSNIVGKDLYVEYALTMPYGNSYFDELPQSIESILNQNSVKLKETTSLTIEDDFLGKSKTNGDPSSFSAYYTTGTDLVDISTLNSSIELSASNYYQISESNPLTNISYSTTSTNTRLQVVCKFNIIEMIENKFGKEIPAIDKLAWIKYNLKSLSYSVIASGNGSQSVKIVPYYYSANRWYTDSTVYNGTGYSILSYTNSNTSPNYYANNSIDDDGNTYLIIYTDTISTEGTTVLLNLAYVKISLELNYDTTFKLYFSENRRAREDSCIPMLVQTETKTIKSYLDIKEPLVTEYKYNEFKGVSNSLPSIDNIIYSNGLQVNSMGTGKFISNNNIRYKASLAYLSKSDMYYYTSEAVNNDITELYITSSKEEFSGIKYLPKSNTYVNLAYGHIIDGKDVDANNFLVIYPYLKNTNGEVRLGIYSSFFRNRVYKGVEQYEFPIPNTPLIK